MLSIQHCAKSCYYSILLLLSFLPTFFIPSVKLNHTALLIFITRTAFTVTSFLLLLVKSRLCLTEIKENYESSLNIINETFFSSFPKKHKNAILVNTMLMLTTAVIFFQ